MLESLVRRGALLTAGVVIGVSFVAQPLKFSAHDVPLVHLVSAGSAIFHGSHALQGLLLVVLLALAVACGTRARKAVGLLGSALVTLLLQLALMPAFDARVAALVAGQPALPAPWLHGLYAVLELLKLAALVAAGSLDRGRVDGSPLRASKPRTPTFRSAR